MARMRTIKPGFFQNDVLAEVEPLGRILFAGLWTIADRAGRLEDRPKRIKIEILPYDNCDVDGLLDDLASKGFITRYESGGTRYIQINNFGKHQSPHQKEPDSVIPSSINEIEKPDTSPVQASDKPVKQDEPEPVEPPFNSNYNSNFNKNRAEQNENAAAQLAGKTGIEVVEELEQIVTQATGAKFVDSFIDGQLKACAGKLHAAGFTPARVKAFLATRRKCPSLNYFVSDIQKWESEQGATAPAGGDLIRFPKPDVPEGLTPGERKRWMENWQKTVTPIVQEVA